MRRSFNQAVGDEKQDGMCSLADGRRQRRDPVWRSEEGSSSGESQGKSSRDPRRWPLHEESANG
jgi:hypothetical protein